jgi:hypothetical protein
MSKFQNVRVRMVFPQPKYRPPYFSAAKIAPALFFRGQNSPPKVFPLPK